MIARLSVWWNIRKLVRRYPECTKELRDAGRDLIKFNCPEEASLCRRLIERCEALEPSVNADEREIREIQNELLLRSERCQVAQLLIPFLRFGHRGRRYAVEILLKVDHRYFPCTDFVSLLKSGNDEAKEHAAVVLGQHGWPLNVESLTQTIAENPGPRTRDACVAAALAILERRIETVRAILSAPCRSCSIDSVEHHERGNSADTLAGIAKLIGTPAFPVLAAHLGSGPRQFKSIIDRCLSPKAVNLSDDQVLEGVLPSLVAVIRDAEKPIDTRTDAVILLGKWLHSSELLDERSRPLVLEAIVRLMGEDFSWQKDHTEAHAHWLRILLDCGYQPRNLLEKILAHLYRCNQTADYRKLAEEILRLSCNDRVEAIQAVKCALDSIGHSEAWSDDNRAKYRLLNLVLMEVAGPQALALFLQGHGLFYDSEFLFKLCTLVEKGPPTDLVGFAQWLGMPRGYVSRYEFLERVVPEYLSERCATSNPLIVEDAFRGAVTLLDSFCLWKLLKISVSSTITRTWYEEDPDPWGSSAYDGDRSETVSTDHSKRFRTIVTDELRRRSLVQMATVDPDSVK